jgi:hypothetical protein
MPRGRVRTTVIEDLNARLRELMQELATCAPEYRARVEKLIRETEFTRDLYVSCVTHKSQGAQHAQAD